MRLFLAATALGLALATSASAGVAPDAQTAYAERRGLLDLDARCTLLTPNTRAALEAGAAQARGALLRSGWTIARVGELERAALSAARARACSDPRTAAAAESARTGFAGWARAAAMTFPGQARAWEARRYPDPNGWRLRQDIEDGGAFGVREQAGRQVLTLTLPLAQAESLPGSAEFRLRNRARVNADMLELPGRTARGLAAGAPAAATATTHFASARTLETSGAARQAVLTFSDAAFAEMLALDPRESVEIRLGTGAATRRILIEVGDIAVARAFLALRADG